MSVDSLKHAGHRPHILITGLPGVGKTTLIRELAKRLAEYHPAGFYTEEIRNKQGTREGFRLVTLCGRQLVLSHVNHPGPHRVGRYGVDVAGFERLLAEIDLRHLPSQLIVIDEIGKMECLLRLKCKAGSDKVASTASLHPRTTRRALRTPRGG